MSISKFSIEDFLLDAFNYCTFVDDIISVSHKRIFERIAKYYLTAEMTDMRYNTSTPNPSFTMQVIIDCINDNNISNLVKDFNLIYNPDADLCTLTVEYLDNTFYTLTI